MLDQFTNLQSWAYHGTPPTFIPRATPLSGINRVPSVFVSSKQATSTKDQATPTAGGADVKGEEPKPIGPLDVPYVGLSLINVIANAASSALPDSNIYYQQYCIDEDFFRLGEAAATWWSCDSHVILLLWGGGVQVTMCTFVQTRKIPTLLASIKCGQTKSKSFQTSWSHDAHMIHMACTRTHKHPTAQTYKLAHVHKMFYMQTHAHAEMLSVATRGSMGRGSCTPGR